ncbi:MAG: hypothetical protein HOE90_11105 [Bacteriovoracaceae bacterium]|jgi:hypothetical protein|nr:hypothetical protein [Bacteriovoracaceae bacterium]
MKTIVLSLLIAGLAFSATADDNLKASPFSLGQTFELTPGRDSTWPSGHAKHKEFEGWDLTYYTTIGYKLTDNDSFKLKHVMTWSNPGHLDKDQSGAWNYSYIQYSRGGLLSEKTHFINFSAYLRMYINNQRGDDTLKDYLNTASTPVSPYARKDRDKTPHIYRLGVSQSKSFGNFGLSTSQYFQVYERATGVDGTSDWKFNLSVGPKYSITKKLEVSAPLYYFHKAVIRKPKRNSSRQKNESFEWVPTVGYQFSDAIYFEAYMDMNNIMASRDKHSFINPHIFDNTSYGLVVDFSLF